MQPSEPLIAWPQPFFELLGFIAIFLAAGAVGFRWIVLGGSGVARSADPAERGLATRAEQRAAAFGLFGAVVTLALFANKLPGFAARRHQTIVQFLSAPANALQLALLALAVLGLALGLARIRNGWLLASVALVANVIRPAVFGGWLRAVNPAHAFAGGLWIGTLFMLITCGLLLLKGSPLDPERRGTVAANMVHAFSPFALASAALLATMGMITAWTHLKRLSSLWTTPYGIALIIKLCLVAGVAALGAWNWKRQRPKLGTEAAAHHLRRSATAELSVAGLVLIVTAILVSLPSPK
jgi:putative copper export protein